MKNLVLSCVYIFSVELCLHSAVVVIFILQVVVKPSSANFQQISIDWILKKLYFTDEETKRIEVCNFDGSFRHVLFTGNIGHLKGITVSPKHG